MWRHGCSRRRRRLAGAAEIERAGERHRQRQRERGGDDSPATIESHLQQRKADANRRTERHGYGSIGHARRRIGTEHRPEAMEVQPCDDRAHRYRDGCQRSQKPKAEPSRRAHFHRKQLAQHDEPVEERGRVHAVERHPCQHQARHRHRVELHHRVQLQHQQRDVRAHQRARHRENSSTSGRTASETQSYLPGAIYFRCAAGRRRRGYFEYPSLFRLQRARPRRPRNCRNARCRDNS